MIAEELFAEENPIKGITAVKDDPASGDVNEPGNTTFTYSIVNISTEKRVFENRHYWYPIAFDHIQQFSNLKQNPGW